MTRILLVEDDDIIGMYIQAALEKMGYEVVDAASSGNEAVEKVLLLKPDLILMDIRLNMDMDGIDAAGKINEQFHVPIIFVTGHSDDETLQRAKKVQPYGFLTKPFEPGSLRSTIEMALYKFKMDMKLRDSEEKFKAVSSSALDAIIMMDYDGNISFWNNAAQKIFGYTADETKGRNLHTLLTPKRYRDAQEKAFPIFLKTGKGKAIGKVLEMEAIRKNGEVFPVELSLSAVQLHGVWNGVGIIRDISEGKRVEEEVRRRTVQAELIYEVSKQVSSKLELTDLLAEIVTGIYSAFGYYSVMIFMKDGAKGDLVMQAIAGGYADVFLKDLQIAVGEGMIGQAALTGESQLAEDVTLNPHYVRKADERTKSELSVPVKSGGEVIGVLDLQSNEANAFNETDIILMKTLVSQIAVAIENAYLFKEVKKDLEKRKEAEDDLKKAQVELIQILNTTAEGIRVIDKNLNISKANRIFLEMLNMKEEDVIGKKCHQILSCSLCHTMNCPLFMFNEDITHTEHDLRMNKLDKQYFDTLLHISPFRDANGRLLGIVESIRDVTDRKDLETQLVQAQKLESIGQLAAGIAHEINTPTQYVGDNTRFLKDSFDDILNLFTQYQDFLQVVKAGNIHQPLIDELEKTIDETDVSYLMDEIPKAIEQSLEGIGRITHIVQAMKEFSHPGAQEKTRVDINKAIETTITVARNEWKYVAEMNINFSSGLPTVPCLQDEFNQVILNLITNAAHAIGDVVGDESGKKGVISITTCLKEEWLEIRITDTGSGIPTAVKAKIFDPFFTTKETGKGTGQGLAISYNVIVKKHGGSLTFETEEGKGTTFIIHLPL
ncbi:PAS domain S-box protein [bacterium]|nr:PAS domain S-box protein [bacterium]